MGAEGLVPGVERITGTSAGYRSNLEGSACKQEMPKKQPKTPFLKAGDPFPW